MPTASSPLWKTRDGTLIPVAAMTDEHLLNAFRMVRRAGPDDPRLAALSHELLERIAMGKRGEHVDDADLLDDCAVAGCDRYGSLDTP